MINNQATLDRPYITVGQDGTSTFNGSTSARIEDAIALAVSNGGGTILVKQGTYTFGGTLALASNINLIGEGNSTIFKLNDNTNATLIRATDCTNITLANFSIDGNKTNNTTSGKGINIIDSTDFNLSNLNIYETKQSGISIEEDDGRTYNGSINNSSISNAGSFGIFISQTSYNISIENCTTFGNGVDIDGDGIHLGNGSDIVSNITVNKCKSYSNYGCGIYANEYTEKITITNCIGYSNSTREGVLPRGNNSICSNNICYLNGDNGIGGDGNNNVYSGNVCFLNQINGIGLENVKNSSIIGNICYNNNQRGTPERAGIRLYDNTPANPSQTIGAKGNIIANNVCYDNQGSPTQDYGIEIYGSNCSDNTIIGNDLKGNKTLPIHISSATTTAQLFNRITADTVVQVNSTIDFNNQILSNLGFINTGAGITKVISGGAITVTRTKTNVDTEGGASSDELTTINGGTSGDLLILGSVSTDRIVTVVRGSNLVLANNFVFTRSSDRLFLTKVGNDWYEIGRSFNGGTTENFSTTLLNKLNGIEANADVTDTTNVSSAGAPIISKGTLAPTSTPSKVGDIFVDTVGLKVYVATGTTASTDWTILN